MTSYMLQKMGPTELHNYIESQVNIFKSLGHNPAMAFTHQIEKKEDGYFHITKRDKEIEVIDWDLEGRGTRIALHSKQPCEKFFQNKYREEDRLMLMGHDICSIDVGETQTSEE